MINTLLIILAGVIGGIILCIPFIKSKRIETAEQEQKLKELKEDYVYVNNQYTDLIEKHSNKYSEFVDLENNCKLINQKQQDALDNLNKLEEQNKTASEKFYNQFMENVQLRIDTETEKLSQQIQDAKQEYEQDYLNVMAEASQEIRKQINEDKAEAEQINNELQNLKQKRTAIIEAFQREEETKLEQDKYKIVLSKEDLVEINRLREVAPFLRNARPVYKIIWEGYYRNATGELIGRIINDKTSGIYLITNTLNNKTYIGQSVNIGTRFTQHIKNGLGIDTPNNILYKAMLKDGVENFTFEVLEKVESEKLNEREKYWIDFYQSDKYGYNMTAGGAKK